MGAWYGEKLMLLGLWFVLVVALLQLVCDHLTSPVCACFLTGLAMSYGGNPPGKGSGKSAEGLPPPLPAPAGPPPGKGGAAGKGAASASSKGGPPSMKGAPPPPQKGKGVMKGKTFTKAKPAGRHTKKSYYVFKSYSSNS